MKKFDLGQTITILANVGVIAGIVFLGIEISQNNRLMEYEKRLSVLELQQNMGDLQIQNAEVRNAIAKSRSGEELSPDENILLFLVRAKNIASIEWQFLELPETHDRLRSLVSANPDTFNSEAWLSTRSAHNPEFVKFVDEARSVGSD